MIFLFLILDTFVMLTQTTGDRFNECLKANVNLKIDIHLFWLDVMCHKNNHCNLYSYVFYFKICLFLKKKIVI